MTTDPVYKNITKITILRDKNSVIRYIVSLLDFNGEKFIIYVKEYNETLCPKEILKQEYFDCEMAEKSYEKLVDDYSAIIQYDQKTDVYAEQIFMDSVDYHVTKPNICKFCKFGFHDHGKWFHPFPQFICENEDNVRTLNRLLEENGMEHKTSKSYMMVHPKVSLFGTCKNFEKREECCEKHTFDQKEFFDDCDFEEFKKKTGKFPQDFDNTDIIIK